jgi:hypothetical protein
MSSNRLTLVPILFTLWACRSSPSSKPDGGAGTDATTEVCDGCPFDTSWAGSQFCPWAGEVLAVDDRRAIR